MAEKICLQWNDFQDDIKSLFWKRREDKDFTDVTLACEDGQQVEAHKVILASSSPFFQNLLKKNKHPHPLIYMKGIKHEILLAVVDFLYLGEANVFQESLDSFLEIAEELKLKGLMGQKEDAEKTESDKKYSIPESVKSSQSYHEGRNSTSSIRNVTSSLNVKLGRCADNQNGNLRWHLPLGVRPPLMAQISRHFFTPLFSFAIESFTPGPSQNYHS